MPTPIQDADPFKGERPHRGLMRFALVALLLVIDLCPEGMPDRFRSPFHERLAEERRTLQAPVDRGLLATACRDRRDTRVFWSSAAEASRSRCSPKAQRRHGAKPARAPGKASKKGKSGWAWARCALAVSKSAMACTVTRSGATRAYPRSTWGVMTPSSVVSARALLMALMRVGLTSAERTWWSPTLPATWVRLPSSCSLCNPPLSITLLIRHLNQATHHRHTGSMRKRAISVFP